MSVSQAPVRVCPRRRGHWEVTLPDRRQVICDTLAEATVTARRTAAELSCEIVVRDAYNRVIAPETLGPPRAPGGSRTPRR